MASTYGSCGPRHARLGRLAEAMSRPIVRWWLARRGLHTWHSRYAQHRSAELRARVEAGETVYLVGIGTASHNTGVALLECSRADGVRVIANDEEERFRGEKHCMRFPDHALALLGQRLDDLGLAARQVHCFVGTWDYSKLLPLAIRGLVEHAPRSLLLPRDGATFGADPSVIAQAVAAPRLLAESGLFGEVRRLPLVMMPHHDNHAYMAYAASPFVAQDAPTLVAVVDGFGDAGAISIYLARGNEVGLRYQNDSIVDSLGILYGIISSTQGGWTANSSEGRYMGAAAWGDQSRLTNRYYRPLREILHCAAGGELLINRQMSGWQLGGQFTPYGEALRAVLGDPIPLDAMWNPDAVLDVDRVSHAETTADRVDKAAALQLVFEDGLFHIVEHWIRATGAERLVLSGGTALNCLANMSLLDQFDRAYYRRHFGRDARLALWVPPTPGDAGTPMGAGIAFALRSGVKASRRCFSSPYLCGRSPTAAEIDRALAAHHGAGNGTRRSSGVEPASCQLGDVRGDLGCRKLARLMATIVAHDGVLGIYQGPAETGPRALGNRSILANPCNPDTLALLNARVKYRERIRPLAPIVTRAAAGELFELAEGAAADDYSAYDYMVLTARVQEAARARIPAVVHRDGTARIQIVRAQHNPLMQAYLEAMGELLGVEVSVNTSLNVGSPIVQTPQQALDVLARAKSLDGLVLVASDGTARVAWLERVGLFEQRSPMRDWLTRAGYATQRRTSTCGGRRVAHRRPMEWYSP